MKLCFLKDVPSEIKAEAEKFICMKSEYDRQRVFNTLCQLAMGHVIQLGDSLEYERECERFARNSIRRVTGLRVTIKYQKNLQSIQSRSMR